MPPKWTSLKTRDQRWPPPVLISWRLTESSYDPKSVLLVASAIDTPWELLIHCKGISDMSSSTPTPAPASGTSPAHAQAHGNWSAVARSHSTLFENIKPSPKPHSPETIPAPSTSLASATLEFAKSHLEPKTLNHSIRIYYFGLAIVEAAFPQWDVDRETWWCTCLLHDIGLADAFHLTTKMSFEVSYGLCGLVACVKYRPQ
jgi:hypothetical protein